MDIKNIICCVLFCLIFYTKSSEISLLNLQAKKSYDSAQNYNKQAGNALNQYSQIYAIHEGAGRAWYVYLKTGIDALLSAAEYYFDALIEDSYNTMFIFDNAVSILSRIELFIDDLEPEDLDKAYEKLLKLKEKMAEIKEKTNKKHESNCEKKNNDEQSKKVS